MLNETYGDDVAFLLVYIREAHPTDGRRSRGNDQLGIKIAQPKTFAERQEVAQQMCTKLEINLPTVIDGLDDSVNKAYNALPDRIYLVGKDGRIAFQGGRGPWGFKPEELAKAIADLKEK